MRPIEQCVYRPPLPSLQLLNGVIERACAAGNPAAAQSAYAHLCQARLAPTAATFAPLLAALQRQHPAGELAELAVGLTEQADQACGTAGQGMQASGCLFRRDPNCVGGLHSWHHLALCTSLHPPRTLPPLPQALLEACRTRGWWELSLQLLAAVEAAGRGPTVDQIDGVLAACAAGGALSEVRLSEGGRLGRPLGSHARQACRGRVHAVLLQVHASKPRPHAFPALPLLPAAWPPSRRARHSPSLRSTACSPHLPATPTWQRRSAQPASGRRLCRTMMPCCSPGEGGREAICLLRAVCGAVSRWGGGSDSCQREAQACQLRSLPCC